MQFSFLGTLKVLDRYRYLVGNCYFILFSQNYSLLWFVTIWLCILGIIIIIIIIIVVIIIIVT